MREYLNASRTLLRLFKACTWLAVAVGVCLAGAAAQTAANPETANDPQQQPAAIPAGPAMAVDITYITKQYPEPPPLSLLDKVLTDEGVQGARVALKENNMTGRMLNHSYALKETFIAGKDDVVAAFKELLASGQRLFVANLEQPDLLAIADLPEAREAIILNVRERR